MPDWVATSIVAITLVFMLVGLLGLIIPVFPGTVVMWLAALGYGVVSGFTPLGWGMFALITVLMLISVSIDNVLMAAGAKQGGASWTALGWGIVAGIAGTLLLPPVGGLIGAPLAIFLYEYRRLGDRAKAFQALRGLALGWGAAFIARFGLGLFMIVFWLVWVWNR